MQKQEKGGMNISVSSVAGLHYIGKSQVAFAAIKAAVTQYTESTAIIYTENGMRLNTVGPGLINTPLVRVLAAK